MQPPLTLFGTGQGKPKNRWGFKASLSFYSRLLCVQGSSALPVLLCSPLQSRDWAGCSLCKLLHISAGNWMSTVVPTLCGVSPTRTWNYSWREWLLLAPSLACDLGKSLIPFLGISLDRDGRSPLCTSEDIYFEKQGQSWM